MLDTVTPFSTKFVYRSKLPVSTLEKGEVALIGSGPGDPELLTIKALNMLRQAEVVLYDSLVSPEILALVSDDAILVCVGKRAGHPSFPQHKTNQLLVDFAKQNYRVARLKGGDPFIFGRGAEELEVLVDAGVNFQVVPGITAASGATAYAGIPLTHREYAQSAMFVTGHLKQESDHLDWSTLSRHNQTLVIYMGLMKSGYIQDQLLNFGRARETPIAVIERGTTDNQKVLFGHLSELSVLAKQAEAPALLVVGEVVELGKRLSWFKSTEQLELTHHHRVGFQYR